MRQQVKEVLFTMFYVVLLIVGIGFFAIVFIHSDDRTKQCESKGGTYLPREDVCVAMTPIKLD